MDKAPETLEDILNLLPPSRQQAVRRQLAKIAEENPAQQLLFELTLLKLGEMQRTANDNKTKSVEVVRTAENPAVNTTLEPLKKEIVSEVVSLRKDMARLVKVEEDTRHIRACTNTTLSKLEAVVPYRAKVAASVILVMLITGACLGWYGQRVYAQYQYEQYMENR